MKTISSIGLLSGTLLLATISRFTAAPAPETLYTLLDEYSGIVFDAERSSLYLAFPGRQVVVRHDLASGNEVAAIPLSLTPTRAAITPDGRWLYVGETHRTEEGWETHDPGKIAEIDLENFTLVREIDYPYSPRHLLARNDRILVVGTPTLWGYEVPCSMPLRANMAGRRSRPR